MPLRSWGRTGGRNEQHICDFWMWGTKIEIFWLEPHFCEKSPKKTPPMWLKNFWATFSLFFPRGALRQRLFQNFSPKLSHIFTVFAKRGSQPAAFSKFSPKLSHIFTVFAKKSEPHFRPFCRRGLSGSGLFKIFPSWATFFEKFAKNQTPNVAQKNFPSWATFFKIIVAGWKMWLNVACPPPIARHPVLAKYLDKILSDSTND